MKIRLSMPWCTWCVCPPNRIVSRMYCPFVHDLCALHAGFQSLTVERAALGEVKSSVFIFESVYSMDDNWMIPSHHSAQGYIP